MGRYRSSGLIRSIDQFESFVVFAGWLFERSSSSSGNGCLALGRSSGSGDGRLVLATVVWFWRRSSGSGDGRLVLATVVWFWRRSSGFGDGPLLAAVLVPPKGGCKEG